MTRQIFVCGTGRSGTSIFTKLLGLHPAVWSFRWESQLFSGMPGLGDLVLGKFDPKRVQTFCERVSTHLYKRNVRGAYDAGLFEIIEFDPLQQALFTLRHRVLDDRDPAKKLQACREFADAVFGPATQSKGAEFWCEKTPRNLLYADVMSDMFPDAKFINVIRDGRSVTSSVLERGFWPVAGCNRFQSTTGFRGPVCFERAVNYWTTLVDISVEQEAKVGPARWLNVRLEDVAFDTAGTFGRIFDFLGIEARDDVLTEVRSEIRPDSVSRDTWSDALTPEQVEAFLAASENNLRRLGY